MESPDTFLICLCLFAVSLCGQGLDVSMDRNPGSYFCGRLHCTSGLTQDRNIFTVLHLTIFDVSQSKTKLKLASVSVDDSSLYIEPSKVREINGTGSITRYQANITLDFRNEDECVYGSFQCELDFINVTGQYNVIYETIAPGNQYNECQSVMAYRLTELRGEISQLRQQNKLILDILLTHFPSTQCSVNSQGVTSGNSTSQIPCTKGMTSVNSRDTFILWCSIQALCDTETDGGGWIIIQRRTKGDVAFYRNWTDYKNGFGTPDTDFWIGNDVIHNLTSQGYNELRVDMELEGRKYFADYSNFSVGDEVSKYKLSVSGYSGTTGDSLAHHDGALFSTFDQDNDVASPVNSAQRWYGAWWYYQNTFSSNLNGGWGLNNPSGAIWGHLSSLQALSAVEMKIRHI